MKKPNIPYFGTSYMSNWEAMMAQHEGDMSTGGGMPGMGGMWTEGKSLWDRFQDVDFMPGGGTWNPLKGWNVVPGNWKSGQGGVGDNLMEFFGTNKMSGDFEQGISHTGSVAPLVWELDLTLNGDHVGTVDSVADGKTSGTQKHKTSADLGHAKWEEETWDWG
jgi:hypothetical protein